MDAMQRRRRVSLRQMRIGHARVASIFKIGSAAVCHLAGRAREFSVVEAAADDLAVAGQIFDDFLDMAEDASRGHLNYAARFILGASVPADAGSEKVVNLIADRLIRSDRVGRLFDEIIGHAEAARHALAPLNLPEAEPYFSDYRRALEATAAALGRERASRMIDTIYAAGGLGRS